MNLRYAQFDRSRLKLQPLSHRKRDLGLENWLRLDEPAPPYEHAELPKTEAAYYFRPRRTILIRTVADGGRSYYFSGDHGATFPALWWAVGAQK